MHVSSLEVYGAPIIDIGHALVGGDLTQVVGTLRNFIPERMVRATGRMMRMNIDDGDIFLGEFVNGALCSVQTSFVTIGNYPGIEARLWSRRRPHLPARRRGRHLRNLKVATPGRRGVSRHADSRSLLSARRERPRIVAHAVLREPDRELHDRDSLRQSGERRQLRRWRVGAGGRERQSNHFGSGDGSACRSPDPRRGARSVFRTLLPCSTRAGDFHGHARVRSSAARLVS